MATNIQKPRGTMDILPDKVAAWQYIEKTAREISAKYGFGEIRFPTFENIDLFQRGVGDTTDVVQKEMYALEQKGNGEARYALRPEGTACIVRSLIENGKCSDAMPQKFCYIINCFRYEKPQAGRFREFFQYGVEMFGADSPLADANVIALANEVISTLGIKGVNLHINSIGCPDCRPKYHAALKEYFNSRKEELCDTCRERLEKNPLRILDCKSPICSKIADNAPKTVDHLCNGCKNHMDILTKALDSLEVPYVVDPRVVRGLDYYTKTVFEFIAPITGAAQSTICGGGRYDGLVKELGGPALSGIGFAAGINRLIDAMEKSGVVIENTEKPLLYIASMGDPAALKAFGIVTRFRAQGHWAESDIVGRSLKAQMKYADKIGARYTLILGDNELAEGKAQLKNMETGEQTTVEIETFTI
ncbi:MAG: histidine--tRNA ligase [Clostridia bacterium]|nr:histidine--tRNA ligase [Clostridia bacterium]